jgi:hypothetical protein
LPNLVSLLALVTELAQQLKLNAGLLPGRSAA